MRYLQWTILCGVYSILLIATSGLGSMPAHAGQTAHTRGGQACSNLGIYVFIGGTAGFNTLANSAIDDTSAVRATGHVGLYQHANAIAAAISAGKVLPVIVSTFAGTGSGQAELGWVGANYFTVPAKQEPTYYKGQYIRNGLVPTEANVDVPDHFSVTKWKAYVDAARTVGIMTVAPIVGPNAKKSPKTNFATDPYYTDQRNAALYGGAIAFDTPPRFFLTGGSGPGYKRFIKNAIAWGNANALRTTVLLSPYVYPKTFNLDTQRYIRVLARDPMTIPTEWSVDDYQDADPNANPYTDPNGGYYMGPDTLANSTAGVGLWVAQNAPVSAQSAPGAITVCTAGHR